MEKASGNYATDLNNPGWILGYGIVNEDSTTLVAMFATASEAQDALPAYGRGHSVRRVSNKSGSDEFMVE